MKDETKEMGEILLNLHGIFFYSGQLIYHQNPKLIELGSDADFFAYAETKDDTDIEKLIQSLRWVTFYEPMYIKSGKVSNILLLNGNPETAQAYVVWGSKESFSLSSAWSNESYALPYPPIEKKEEKQ